MKKNVKRFVSMTMAMLVAAGSLAGCGGGGSASTGESAKAAANTGGSSGGAVTVKVSLSQAATEPPVKAAEYFKEIVEERSNGEIKVEIYPDNQLGNERDVIEGMQLGTVEMAMTSVAPFSSFVPSVNIFCLPFLWRDKEHMYSVLDSDEIGMSYSGDCEEKGFHLMGFLDLGTRHIMTTQKTINSIEDLKNLRSGPWKIRYSWIPLPHSAQARCRWHTANYTQRCSRTLLTVQKRPIQTIIPRSFMRQRRTGQWLDGPTT